MAEKDKERYIREYVAYQETDSYKKFMRKKFPGLAKKQKVEQRKAETPSQKAAKEKVSWCTVWLDVASQPGWFWISRITDILQENFFPRVC